MGMCIRGRKRKLPAIERAAKETANTQARQFPTRQTPMSIRERRRRRKTNTTPSTNSHSAIAGPAIHHKKRSPGEPSTAAGMDSLMSFAATQMAAGRPRAKIKNSVKSRNGKWLTVISTKADVVHGEKTAQETLC